MKTSDLFQLLDEISQEHVPHNVNLLPGVMANIEKGKNKTMKPKIKFASAVFLTATAIVLLIFTIPGAATAMRKVFGFIPGIGLVEQNVNLRVLAEPVIQTRDGFTVTVENGVIDNSATVITYNVEGPFESGSFQTDKTISDICFVGAELRLPDGTVYQAPAGFPDETWETGYRVKYDYSAIPAEIGQVTLVLPCIHAMPIGQGPQNWELPLTFVTAPEDMAVYPIGGHETQSNNDPINIAGDPTLGIDMYLDSVIPVADGQLVQVRVDWRNNPNISGVNLNPADITIISREGNKIGFEPSSEAVNPNEGDQTSSAFGFKTSAMDASSSAKLIINAASEVIMKSMASFTFDAAVGSPVDNVWVINQDLDLDGRTLRILKVTLDEYSGNTSLTIDMESSDDIIAAGVTDLDHLIISGAEGKSHDISDGVNTLHKFWVTLNYDGGLPEGPITLTVPNYTIRVAGEPWIVEWTPAAASTSASEEEKQSQTEYLSKEDWQKVWNNAQPVPAELNKLLLLEVTMDDGRLHDQLVVSRLDGSDMRFLVEDAGNAAVSPDGSQIVYVDSTGGIQIYDLEKGISKPLADSASFVEIGRIFWSPDGKQIGFSATTASAGNNIYLTNLDGSAPQLVEAGEPLKIMQGWLPDGRILYVTQDPNGPVLKLIDPQSGSMSTLFNVPQLATSVAVSKDGKRLAIHSLDESTGDQNLYIYNADGSQRRSVLKMNADGYLRGMTWSTEGNWLIVDLTWDIASEPYTKAMIQADSIQMIPLPDLEGMVLDWMQ